MKPAKVSTHLAVTALLLLVVPPCVAQTGVCCFVGCVCALTTEEECINGGGIWYGGDSCDPNPCDCPPVECCLADGTCLVTTEPECIAMGGALAGYGWWCDPNPCPQPGACCYVNGTCVIMPYEDCLALEPEGACTWVPYDSCDPNPCPACLTLACCLPDGMCQIYCSYEECEADGGEVLGCFCELHPCPAIGACCLAGGYCLERTQTECSSLDGLYMGHEIPCDPNPCYTSSVPEISTEETTWGRIKSAYR